MKDQFIEALRTAANQLHYEGKQPEGVLLQGAVGMYTSEWWFTAPVWNDPGEVSGEINWK